MLYTLKKYLRFFSLFNQRDQYGTHYNIHNIPPSACTSASSPYYFQYIIKNPRSHIRENYTGGIPVPEIFFTHANSTVVFAYLRIFFMNMKSLSRFVTSVG